MAYILSAERDAEEFDAANWVRYRDYLKSVEGRFPPNAYGIASSAWWYSFHEPGAPHDASLISSAVAEGPVGSRSVSIELESAETGRILLRYAAVTRHLLETPPPRRGGPGQWRYDEFALAPDGRFIHTIEWSRGAVWQITAGELFHEHRP
jgi:hypothetical protein